MVFLEFLKDHVLVGLWLAFLFGMFVGLILNKQFWRKRDDTVDEIEQRLRERVAFSQKFSEAWGRVHGPTDEFLQKKCEVEARIKQGCRRT